MSYPTPTSPLYALAVSFIRATNANDFAALERLFADNGEFSNQNHPKSLLTPGNDARIGKEVYIERAKQMFGSVIEEIAADIDHPVNVIEAKDTIVLQLTSDGRLKNGNRINTDLLYILRFTDDGKKMRSIDIWSDSALAHAAFAGAAFPRVGKDGMVENLEKVAGKKTKGIEKTE